MSADLILKAKVVPFNDTFQLIDGQSAQELVSGRFPSPTSLLG